MARWVELSWAGLGWADDAVCTRALLSCWGQCAFLCWGTLLHRQTVCVVGYNMPCHAIPPGDRSPANPSLVADAIELHGSELEKVRQHQTQVAIQ
jgi:hypothetical protein